jgi:hypothetical protein
LRYPYHCRSKQEVPPLEEAVAVLEEREKCPTTAKEGVAEKEEVVSEEETVGEAPKAQQCCIDLDRREAPKAQQCCIDLDRREAVVFRDRRQVVDLDRQQAVAVVVLVLAAAVWNPGHFVGKEDHSPDDQREETYWMR